MRLTKVYPIASFKALEDEGPGRFEAVVSVFGNVDFQGDRSMPGMFTKTLNKWRKSGDPVPCVWSHDWLNPDAFVGDASPDEMQEMLKPIGKDGTGGLKVRGTMDVHKPFAGQVFDLLKSRRIKEWSFAYDTIREQTNEKDGANELLEVDLIEFGPCLKGANPSTYTIGAKSALETELKEAYTRAQIWQQRIDRVAGWDAYDPKVADMLLKTYKDGTYKAVEIPAPIPEVAEMVREELIKIATKPWHVEKRGDQWCVVKDSTDETVSCHDSEDDANAHMRALYANEASEDPDETKSIDDVHAEALTINEARRMQDLPALSSTAGDFSLNYSTSTSTDGTTWTISMPEPNGTKIGRVIGAKAAEELKTDLTEAITGAVDRFVEKINGVETPEPKIEEPETKTEEVPDPPVDPDMEIKARLSALFEEGNHR